MHDELTEVDIRKIKEELENRKNVLRPQLHEEVKRTREYGDLSENAEYHTAKHERNRNESRIRYLEKMLETAVVVKAGADSTGIALCDIVTYLNERNGTVKKIQLVTTLRQDAMRGFISKESPLGRAIAGHRAGDRVQVQITPDNCYYVTIQTVEHGEDDDSLPISSF